jgi:hypothetical protein
MEDEDYFQFGDDVVFADGAGLYYGHMYSNTQITVAVAVAGTPYEVQTAGADFTTGELNYVTFSDHYLDVGANGAGKYLVSWGMSLATAAAGANVEVEGGLMIDGVAQAEGRAHRTIANNTDTGNFASCAILDLAANKQVSLYVQNETNTTNINVEHANLTITQIGGT